MTNQASEELREIDKTIINTKDPDQFIDLLNYDSSVTGQYNGNLPVQRHRLIFEAWLTAYTDKQVEAVLDRLRSYAVYGEYSTADDDSEQGEVVPVMAIEAERNKLKESSNA